MILQHDSAAARVTVEKFCAHNKIDVPDIDFRPKLRPNSFGYFSQPRLIVVDALHCKGIIDNPRVWTYPGYTADLTVLGVTAHELGHYVHFVRGWREVLRAWHSMTMSCLEEQPVGSYARTQPHEDLAEAFKVFVTNPSLLECIAPKRYAFFVNSMSLVPVESRHWREILGDSPRHIRAVENKC